MSAVMIPEMMTTVVAKPSVSSNMLLQVANWQLYESLQAVFDGYRNVRLTYTDGDLEMRVTSPPHGRYSVTIDNVVMVLSEELDLEICPVGSSALKRPDLEKGLEADQSYYVQHESVMRDKRKLDLLKMPPPD